MPFGGAPSSGFARYPPDRVNRRPPRPMMPSRPLPLRRALFAGACLASLASSRSAAATGFVVGTTDAPVTSDAASVVVVREGARTAVTLAVDVSGPAAPMAIVVPVPAEVAKADVHAAPADALAHLDRFTGPRIVETWEQDPCADAGDAGAHDGGSRGPGPAAAPAQSLADKVAAWTARSGGGRVATAAAAVSLAAPSWRATARPIWPAADAASISATAAR